MMTLSSLEGSGWIGGKYSRGGGGAVVVVGGGGGGAVVVGNGNGIGG